MKIYTVMQAAFAVSSDEDATIYTEGEFIAEVFSELDEAVNTAQMRARQYPGRHVWVVEGHAVKSFRCEPLPVLESVPAVHVAQ